MCHHFQSWASEANFFPEAVWINVESKSKAATLFLAGSVVLVPPWPATSYFPTRRVFAALPLSTPRSCQNTFSVGSEDFCEAGVKNDATVLLVVVDCSFRFKAGGDIGASWSILRLEEFEELAILYNVLRTVILSRAPRL